MGAGASLGDGVKLTSEEVEDIYNGAVGVVKDKVSGDEGREGVLVVGQHSEAMTIATSHKAVMNEIFSFGSLRSPLPLTAPPTRLHAGWRQA